jgi:small subunit ribosomal protein S11
MSKFLKNLQQKGVIHIQSTKNNTLITLTDLQGNTKFKTSAGTLGFKNSRKSTTYAAQAAAEELANKALILGFSSVIIKIKGLGYGKESTIRALYKSRLIITKLIEQTPIPHNGCRSPKKRRI